MAEQQIFRTAFNGFHRDDVVHYIEELNTKHAAEVEQLNNELQYLREQLEALENAAPVVVETAAPVAAVPAPAVDVNEELAAELTKTQEQLLTQEAENRRLQSLLDAALTRQSEQRMNVELDTYRRAERVEREARNRANAVYGQANIALSNATTKVDETASQIAELAESTMQQLKQLQLAISGSKQVLRDTAAVLYSIRPEDEE